MPVEVTDKVQAAPQAKADSAIHKAAQSAWAPGATLFKLGAVCNETYNQSLAAQYDGLPQCAITGIGNGVKSLLSLGELGLEAGADAIKVVAADLQIGYETASYPALAEVHSDELAQNLRQLGTKYDQILEPSKRGYENIQTDLANIGAQSNGDSTAYARLLTDPANNIIRAADNFTSQTPGKQVEAIFEQSTQLAAFGFAEKALAGLTTLSTAQFAEKFDHLLAKMDEHLMRVRSASLTSELQPAGVPKGWVPKDGGTGSDDNFFAMSADKAFRGDHDPWAPRNSTTGKFKSHIDKNGDLTPPDPNGMFKGEPVDVVHHLCGSFYKYHKEHSPFTSLSEKGEIIEKYGERYKITVDLNALNKAIAAGEVSNVEIIPHDKVFQMIDASKCADYSKKLARKYANRDKEVLVRGAIPERFFTVEDISK